MCEYEAKLIAWLDDELDAGAAREIELHLDSCEICASQAAAYREISQAFAAYCDSSAVIVSRRTRSRYIAWAALSTAAAAAAMLWMLGQPPATLPPLNLKIAEPPAMALVITPPAPHETIKRVHRAANTVAAAPGREINAEPIVEIAIPADAIFPPGAFPTGLAFAADLSIGGDGSTETLRVRPAAYLK